MAGRLAEPRRAAAARAERPLVAGSEGQRPRWPDHGAGRSSHLEGLARGCAGRHCARGRRDSVPPAAARANTESRSASASEAPAGEDTAQTAKHRVPRTSSSRAARCRTPPSAAGGGAHGAQSRAVAPRDHALRGGSHAGAGAPRAACRRVRAPRHRLTLTAYFVAACARALMAHPTVNATFHDEALELHADANIGVGTALGNEGLIVPVIHEAQHMSLPQLASRLGELVGAARAGKLAPQEVRGGTFTISNHGVSGSLLAAPIVINQPQVADIGRRQGRAARARSGNARRRGDRGAHALLSHAHDRPSRTRRLPGERISRARSSKPSSTGARTSSRHRRCRRTA